MISSSGTSSGMPDFGSQLKSFTSWAVSDCDHADDQAADHCGDHVLEPAEDRRGEGRDDEEGVLDRRGRGDRGDQDAGQTGDHRADHPVDRGEPVGRDVADVRALLALGRGPGGQPEAA